MRAPSIRDTVRDTVRVRVRVRVRVGVSERIGGVDLQRISDSLCRGS